MTRQAVSRQIALLEKELEVPLFHRTTAKVELTVAGEIYVNFFTRVNEEWKETKRKVRRVMEQQGESINVGCLYSFGLGEDVFRAVEKLRDEGLLLRVNWSSREPHDLLDELAARHLDIIFTFDDSLREYLLVDEMDYVPFLVSEAVLLASSQYPGLTEETAALQLKDEPCYISDGMVSARHRKKRFVEEWAEWGILFTDVHILSNRESVQNMVALRRGVTIGTEYETFSQAENIRAFPMGKTVTIDCVWRRGESNPSVLALVEAMKQMKKEL